MAEVKQYTFDPIGRVPENFIKGERHTITPRNGYDYHYIIPDFAPFFSHDFKMYTQDTTGVKKYLVEGVDYNLGFRFIQATIRTGKPVYGSVSMVNRRFAGTVYLEYRTVGGTWNITKNKILEILADIANNPLIITWEQVANIPFNFPPVEHYHHVDDLTGMKDIYKVMEKMLVHLFNNSQEGLATHITNTNNPHKVTKAQVGLGNVQNLPILPRDRGADRSDSYYMTPRATAEVITNLAIAALNTHTAERNPHRLTAADINVYTKQETEAKLGTKLGKSEKAADSAKAYGKDFDVLKRDVLAGVAADSVLFNGTTYTDMVKDVIRRVNAQDPTSGRLSQGDLEALVATMKTANSKLFDGKNHDSYAQWLQETKRWNAVTLENKSLAQVIADARAGKVNDSSALEGRNSNQLATWLKSNFQFPAETLGGKSLADIMADSARQTSANSTKLNNRTDEQLATWILAKTINAATLQGKNVATIVSEAKQNVNAVTVGGKNVATIINEAKQNVNAVQLGGKSLQQIMTDVASEIAKAAPRNINAATLEGKNVTQLLADALNHINGKANARTLNNKTDAQLITEARNGTVANSTKFANLSERQWMERIQNQNNIWLPAHSSLPQPRWVELFELDLASANRYLRISIDIRHALRFNRTGKEQQLKDTLMLSTAFEKSVQMGGSLTPIPQLTLKLASGTAGKFSNEELAEQYKHSFWFRRTVRGSSVIGTLMFLDKGNLDDGTWSTGSVELIDSYAGNIKLLKQYSRENVPDNHKRVQPGEFDETANALKVPVKFIDSESTNKALEGSVANLSRDKANKTEVLLKTDRVSGDYQINREHAGNNDTNKVPTMSTLNSMITHLGLDSRNTFNRLLETDLPRHFKLGSLQSNGTANAWPSSAQYSPIAWLPANKVANGGGMLFGGDLTTGKAYYQIIKQGARQETNKWHAIASDADLTALRNAILESNGNLKNDLVRVGNNAKNILSKNPSGELEVNINYGSTYTYVDAVNGNDDTGDGTKNKPYRTILRASRDCKAFHRNILELRANQTHVYNHPQSGTDTANFQGSTTIRTYRVNEPDTAKATIEYRGLTKTTSSDGREYLNRGGINIYGYRLEFYNVKLTQVIPEGWATRTDYSRSTNSGWFSPYNSDCTLLVFQRCIIDLKDKKVIRSGGSEMICPLVAINASNSTLSVSFGEMTTTDISGNNPVVESFHGARPKVNFAHANQSTRDAFYKRILSDSSIVNGSYKYYDIIDWNDNTGAVKDIKVLTGTAKHDTLLPIPIGFNENECIFIIRPEMDITIFDETNQASGSYSPTVYTNRYWKLDGRRVKMGIYQQEIRNNYGNTAEMIRNVENFYNSNQTRGYSFFNERARTIHSSSLADPMISLATVHYTVIAVKKTGPLAGTT